MIGDNFRCDTLLAEILENMVSEISLYKVSPHLVHSTIWSGLCNLKHVPVVFPGHLPYFRKMGHGMLHFRNLLGDGLTGVFLDLK